MYKIRKILIKQMMNDRYKQFKDSSTDQNYNQMEASQSITLSVILDC